MNSFPKAILDKFVGLYMKKYLDSGECHIDSGMKWLDVIGRSLSMSNWGGELYHREVVVEV